MFHRQSFTIAIVLMVGILSFVPLAYDGGVRAKRVRVSSG
jgi:hypothetical protein